MKKSLWTMILAAMLIVLGSAPTWAAEDVRNADSEAFRVIGYYSGSLFDEPVKSLQTDKLTHIMYAFLIPQMDGTCLPIEKPEQLQAIVKQAHDDGAKVYIAVGGWSYQNVPLAATFETIGADDGLRMKFVSSVLDCVRTYDLDGVELDWEHPMSYSAESYEKMVLDLHEALRKEGKALTAALNGAWSTTAGPETSEYISEKCLDAFEFICVMGYDMNNEEHSPFWFADSSIEYWKNRGVPQEKIVLGMPLYARPSWMQYRHLVEMNPEYAYNDYAATQPLASYYNGLNTLCKKTVLAYEKAGGVMLFDVNEDVLGKYSVLGMIDDTVSQIEAYGFLIGFSADAVESGGGIRSSITTDKDIDVILQQRDLKGQLISRWVYMNPKPILESDRTLVPVRVMSDRMGFDVQWNEADRTVAVSNDTMEILLTIDSEKAVKRLFRDTGGMDETILTMDCPARIINGRTMLPLRFVSENFGRRVNWNPEQLEVTIEN